MYLCFLFFAKNYLNCESALQSTSQSWVLKTSEARVSTNLWAWTRPAEVGKMKIIYLLPLSLPSTSCQRHRLPSKKGRIVRLLLTTLDLWKSQGIGCDVFYIETIPRDRDRQRSTKISVEGKIFIIVHNFSFW